MLIVLSNTDLKINQTDEKIVVNFPDDYSGEFPTLAGVTLEKGASLGDVAKLAKLFRDIASMCDIIGSISNE